MTKIFIASSFLTTFLFSTVAHSNTFDVEQTVWAEKIGLCETSIQKQMCTTTQYCKDLEDYEKYLMKGSTQTYVDYHLQAADTSKKSLALLLKNLKRSNRYKEIDLEAHVECP